MTGFARIAVALTLALALIPRPALAHEFWIEAQQFQVAPDATVAAGLLNGQNFRGVELAWFDGRVDFAGWVQGTTKGTFAARAGDRPALTLPAPGPGLLRLIYQSTPSTITYSDWATFEAFATGKGHTWALAEHVARGLPKTGFTESYTRHCKALVAVGDGAGADAPAGMSAELVALTNPYTDPAADGLRVEMRLDGQPLPGQQIDVFEKSIDGHFALSHVTTDAEGRALVPLTPGRRYLLDAVVLRPAAPGTDHAWQSLWASLTFQVPQ